MTRNASWSGCGTSGPTTSSLNAPRQPKQFRYLLTPIVRRLDVVLRRWYEIREFTADPTCLLRVELTRARSCVTLSDGAQIRAGDFVAVLHLWNEHLPPYAEGPSLRWANVMGRRFQVSLGAVAERMRLDPAWRGVRALRARPAMSHRQNAVQLGRVAARFGFEAITSERAAIGQFRRLSCDCLAWLMTCAFNPAALRRLAFRRARQDFWMSRERLLAQYARAEVPSCVSTHDQPNNSTGSQVRRRRAATMAAIRHIPSAAITPMPPCDISNRIGSPLGPWITAITPAATATAGTVAPSPIASPTVKTTPFRNKVE